MKYGIISYGKNPYIKGKQFCNLGDVFQSLAVRNLYHESGIKNKDLINISRYNLEKYSGPTVRLPLNAWFGHGYVGTRIKKLSSHIHPIPIGFHCLSKSNVPKVFWDKNYLIGCRDEGTYRLMKSLKLHAFLSGCLTLTFPTREMTSNQNKIYAVDLPEDIVEKLTTKFKDKLIVKNQSIPLDQHMSATEEANYCMRKAEERLNEYRDNAALMVTSRLHCAVPCLAMGIPVILIREHYDERFEWLEKFIPLYKNSDFDNINFDVHAIDVTEIKNELKALAINEILYEKTDKNIAKKIHAFYMDRNKMDIHIALKLRIYNRIHQYFPNLAEFIRVKVLSSFSMEKKYTSKK